MENNIDINHKKFETENDCKLILFEELPGEIKEWLMFGKYNITKNYSCYKHINKLYDKYIVRFFTNDYEYLIHLIKPNRTNNGGYISGCFSCRNIYTTINVKDFYDNHYHKQTITKILKKGNDFYYGQYNQQTFDKILKDILSN